MKETPKALQAFEDYYAMGSARSLSKLLVRYKKRKDPPTRRMTTLKQWSTKHGWQERIKDRIRDAWQELSEQLKDDRETILRSGLALDYQRVLELQEMATKLLDEFETELWLEETKSLGPWGTTTVRRFNAPLVRELRGVLDDIARELGHRAGVLKVEDEEGRVVPIRLVEVMLQTARPEPPGDE